MYERFTDRARKVMQLANQEAQRFNHEYIGTEHILLGLISEQEGVASQVLMNFGLKVEDIRSEVLKILGPSVSDRALVSPVVLQEPAAAPPPAPEPPPTDPKSVLADHIKWLRTVL